MSRVNCGLPVLCCAVLCCVVLCCAVLCCAVLCCAVLCCAVLMEREDGDVMNTFYPSLFLLMGDGRTTDSCNRLGYTTVHLKILPLLPQRTLLI